MADEKDLYIKISKGAVESFMYIASDLMMAEIL